jgi:hypothetical protein
MTQGSETTPLPLKILSHLQSERTGFFHSGVLEGLRRNRLINLMANPTDLHSANEFMDLLGSRLGLRNAGGRYDELGIASSIQAPLKWLFSRRVGREFFSRHTTLSVLHMVQNAIGSKRPISIREVQTWWAEWIDRQLISNSQKTQFKQELEQHQILGYDLTVLSPQGDVVINPAIILAMLRTMGIVKIPKSTASR